MSEHDDRRYTIGEVCKQTGVPDYLLRQWEQKFPQLKPKRNRAGRRYYSGADIDLVRHIKYLLHHDKLTIPGARLRLSQELHGLGRPNNRQDVVDLLDKLQDNVRGMIHLLDSV